MSPPDDALIIKGVVVFGRIFIGIDHPSVKPISDSMAESVGYSWFGEYESETIAYFLIALNSESPQFHLYDPFHLILRV